MIDREVKNRQEWQQITPSEYPVWVKCDKLSNKRSDLQHRKYFALLNKIKKHLVEEQGYYTDQDAIHESFKRMSGMTEKVQDVNGEWMTRLKSIKKSSKDATVKELNFLIEFAYQWAAENLGVDLGE